MKSLEWKWGLIIGLANTGWLFSSYWFGMHDSGIGLMQVMVAMSFFISLAGYALALRAITRVEPETNFLEGMRSGVIIAGIAATLAMISQLIYFHWINPGWTAYMVAETRRHFSAMGLEAPQIEEMAIQAEKSFGLTSYVFQAGLGALISGIIFSALAMGVIRLRAR